MADNFKFAQLQAFTLAGAGATVGATSVTLTTMKDIDGNALNMANDFGTIGYGTLEPGSGAQEEQISFTGLTNNANGTTTLTGVKTVDFMYPYTETSGLAKTHPGGTQFVITNTSGYYNKFVSKDNDETINGTISFAAVPNSSQNPVNGTDLANRQWVLSVVAGGTLTFNQIVISGTAGETLAAGDFIYLKEADGRWWKTDADTAATVENVNLGIAQGAGTAGNAIDTGVLISGLATLSGLTANTKYYFSNTAGAISTSAGTTEVTAGYAYSTTLFVFAPGYDQHITENIQDALTPGGVYGTPSSSNPYLTKDYNASSSGVPAVHVYTANARIGSSTTRFDITNTVGTTYRYTYDGTGTDPNINAGTFPIGTIIDVQGANFAAGNKGIFTTTGVGANYFEVTNASGVVESDKTLGIGYMTKGQTWTKPAALKYIKLQVLGAGAGSWATSNTSSGNQDGTGGGGAGGYSEKIIAAGSLGATETFVVGPGGLGGIGSGVTGTAGIRSIFGSHATANGGAIGVTSGVGGIGGTASGGDLNVKGGDGDAIYNGSTSSADIENTAGMGGTSYFGGQANTSSTGAYGSGGHGAFVDNALSVPGIDGQPGLVIVTEYFS